MDLRDRIKERQKTAAKCAAIARDQCGRPTAFVGEAYGSCVERDAYNQGCKDAAAAIEAFWSDEAIYERVMKALSDDGLITDEAHRLAAQQSAAPAMPATVPVSVGQLRCDPRTGLPWVVDKIIQTLPELPHEVLLEWYGDRVAREDVSVVVTWPLVTAPPRPESAAAAFGPRKPKD